MVVLIDTAGESRNFAEDGVLMRYDAAIVGGGPAGAAAAITLARGGASVALLERTDYREWRVGEHLPPYAGFVLAELGAWPRFQCLPHLHCTGRITVWGSDSPAVEDYLFHPLGHGWLLDRARFDRDLADAAADVGATLMLGTTVRHAARIEGDWQLSTRRAGIGDATRDGSLCARLLIDATGLAGLPALRSESRRTLLDHQVAHVCIHETAGRVKTSDNTSPNVDTPGTRLSIESAEYGWWYQCPLPNSRTVTALLSDADLLPARHAEGLRQMMERREGTTLVRTRSPEDMRLQKFMRLSACSALVTPIAGPDWFKIGDAGQAVDPLAGQGIVRALWTGQHGGTAALAHLSGDRTALEAYADLVASGLEVYLSERQGTYRREKRWPAAPYWQRR